MAETEDPRLVNLLRIEICRLTVLQTGKSKTEGRAPTKGEGGLRGREGRGGERRKVDEMRKIRGRPRD